MRRALGTWVSAVVHLLLVGWVRGDQAGSGVSKSPHGNLQIPCENCHTQSAWKPIRSKPEFDHNKTRFPLRGLHEGVACVQCHKSLVFTNVGTKCADCHSDIHRGQFGLNCERCHTVKGWQINLRTIPGHENRFPLVAAHASLVCDDCHKGAAVSQFQGLSTACISCHARDFTQVAFPNHQAANFPTDCQACHTMDSWRWAAFDHLKFTGYALTGMHATLDCQACHVNGNISSSSCVSCHLKDYNGTNNPNHPAAGIPQQCEICHTTSGWVPATFNHNLTGFPLTGAHVKVPCNNCHIGGVFAGTPTDCYSCHKKDYQSTTNPNHVAAGFPTTCQLCHNTTAWTGATFNHTWFPVPHFTAQLCSDCHTNPSNYAVFVCTNCHTQAQTAQQHDGVQGYVWNSANCYSCHPSGRAGD